MKNSEQVAVEVSPELKMLLWMQDRIEKALPKYPSTKEIEEYESNYDVEPID